MTKRVFGIVGWKNSGKTTLTEKLITELTARGWKVSSVKHAHHAFDIDHEGTDSFRHRIAGAGETAIVSSARWALMHESRDGEEPPLTEILARLSPCDIVLIEGYKSQAHAKIEARRLASRDHDPLEGAVPGIAAIAADHVVNGTALPVFNLDDIAAIASFIEKQSGLTS